MRNFLRPHRLRLLAVFAASLGMTSGCATYQYSKNVKLVSFEDEVLAGKSVGPIRGEDCVWSVLGYPLGSKVTLDRAFANARAQRSSTIGDSFGGNRETSANMVVRYMNNVSTDYEGFDAYIVAKRCLVVKGVGYQ